MRSTLLLATGLFVVTHLDTFAVLVAFCVDDAYTTGEVFAGHLVGVAVGLAAAVALATVADAALREWAFLLGAVPVAIGVLSLRYRRSDDPLPNADGVGTRVRGFGPLDGFAGFAVVAAVSVGLSGENLAVFVPFFIGLTPDELGAVIAWYVAASVVTFLLAGGVARAAPTKPPAWVDRWLVPGTLVVVGLYVLGTGFAV
ncbi:cadmium transporter [Halorubrum sp. JWXQ-INN 858]|uniref:cadmium resistance transporter n=1 Tax=Halorubrum sp. JWXQ-INN 858 TaxID=2690782 RepID=UPI00135C6DA6|nr:cadmium resistance transporter [Halorubrum sp. JWXQ-INN 858]MWV66087.1 cadmium transporter [Halorubrum sp. JWXQ-INN 858]